MHEFLVIRKKENRSTPSNEYFNVIVNNNNGNIVNHGNNIDWNVEHSVQKLEIIL